MDYQEFIKKIKKLQPKHKQLIIGIDGGGGAGKTTFATKLANSLNAKILHLDDLYKATKDRVNENQNGEVNIDFDWDRIEKEIFIPIRNGSEINYHHYDWQEDKITHAVKIPQDTPVIIEGGYALQPRFFKDYDYTIFVEAPEEMRLERAIVRDGEHMRSYWEKVWLPADKRYRDIHKVDKIADLVINGSTEID